MARTADIGDRHALKLVLGTIARCAATEEAAAEFVV